MDLRGIDTQGEVKWVTEGLWWRDRQTTRWRKITERESGSVERKTRSSTKKEKMTLDKTKHKKTELGGEKNWQRKPKGGYKWINSTECWWSGAAVLPFDVWFTDRDSQFVSITCPHLGGKPITGEREEHLAASFPSLISSLCSFLRPLHGFPGKSPTEANALPASVQLYFVWIKKHPPSPLYYTFFLFATFLWLSLLCKSLLIFLDSFCIFIHTSLLIVTKELLCVSRKHAFTLM